MITNRLVDLSINNFYLIRDAFFNAKEILLDSVFFNFTEARINGLNYILAPIENTPKPIKPFIK